MMNIRGPFFVFVITSFCINYDSSVTAKVDDRSTLSSETKDRIKKLFKNPDLNFIQREYEKKCLKEKKAEKMMLATQFHCGINTAKAEIHIVMNTQQIFNRVPNLNLTAGHEDRWNNLDLPENTVRILYECDGNPPSNPLDFYTIRFRNFYFRIKYEEYGNSKFFRTLRQILHEEYKGQKMETVYQTFAATITRDYTFLCNEHHSNLIKLLQSVAFSSTENILPHLFKQNKGWFMDSTHIKNINILRCAYYYRKVHKIKGYPCQNGLGMDVELPLFDRCGALEVRHSSTLKQKRDSVQTQVKSTPHRSPRKKITLKRNNMFNN